MKDDMEYEVLALQAAVEELKSLEIRNTIRLLGIVLIVAGALVYAFRMLKRPLATTVPDKAEEPPHLVTPSDVEPSLVALDAANKALAAAKAVRPRIVVKYLPTLDDQFVDIKKRPLLSSYVLGDMFDIASVHPTTPDLGIGEQATFKALTMKPPGSTVGLTDGTITTNETTKAASA